MIANSRLKQIQGLARNTLRDHDRLRLPVQPKEFAEHLGIVVQSWNPSDPDISGCLMRMGNSFGILYSTAIKNEGFQNFTIAHELGHYFIDGHSTSLLAAGPHLSHSGFISKDRHEEEADAFATEFLMPWQLIEPMIRMAGGGFEIVKAISESCKSSLIASAIRYCQVAKASVSVVVSHNGVVEFMTASNNFRQMPGINWLKRCDRIPVTVPSARYGDDLNWIKQCAIAEEGSLLSHWFPDAESLEVEEDIAGLGNYGRLLTILEVDWTPEGDDVDEAETDNYIDRWKDGIFRPRK